jgi:diguanylate cyclase (GGDEF)-like protein
MANVELESRAPQAGQGHAATPLPSEPPNLHVVFQPIVDLMTASPIGYEVLARGEAPLESPELLFSAARAAGQVWELERACRLAAIRRIAELTLPSSCLLFLNASPDVLEDPRFVEGFTLGQLLQHGIEPGRIVIEITENHHISDPARLQQVIAHYTGQGFQFAADDFGSGHSSLLSLIACAPQFIKLDMEVVRDIDRHPYKRHLVRSLTAFAASVDTRLVAEGVESWDELEMLLRLGVRYAQGFLLARPQPEPPVLDERMQERLRLSLRSAQGGFNDPDEAVDSLVAMPMTIPVGGMNAAQLESAFRGSSLDHAVVVDRGRPRGLITREDLFTKLAGRYAYALRQRKTAEEVVKSTVLTVSEGTAITTLATRAMERAPAELYDPVVVVDASGKLVGTVTMKGLIKRSVELQVRSAQNANPLTGLPGNRAIHKWIQTATDVPMLTIVYADLDRFKEYNDRYGFLMGDELIRLAARVLGRALINDPEETRLGHLGGDDFVAVFPGGVDHDALARACALFDSEKLELFDADDAQHGFIVARNRIGQSEQVPLVTLSLAVIERGRISGELHPGVLGQIAASLKREVKQRTASLQRSAFMVDRRSYPPPPG